MAAFRWKALQEYSPFGQLLAAFMWEQRPPLNPAQISDLTGIDYLTVYRWFANNAAPDPTHLVRLAQCTPLSVQTLFVAAGYGSDDFPLFSLAEAWEHVRGQIMTASSVGLEDHAIALRVLQAVRDETLAHHQGAEVTQPLLEAADDAEPATL